MRLEGEPSPSSQDAIWDYFQNEGRESFDGARARLGFLARRARRRFPGAGELRVLNVGVGGGIFEEIAAELGMAVHAVDPNERAIAAVAARLDLAERARVGSSGAIPFPDGTFQAVVASELLEHLGDEELQRSLAEFDRVLAPGGVLLGTVPAREDLRTNEVVCPTCTNRFHRWGHVRTFDRVTLSRLLERTFRDVRVDERPFPSWSTLNWKGRVGATLKLGLNRIGIHGSGESLFFQASAAGTGS